MPLDFESLVQKVWGWEVLQERAHLRPLGAHLLAETHDLPRVTHGGCVSLGYQRLAAFLFFVKPLSWEQECCKYLTNPFRENRGNRIRSGLMSGET